MVKHHEEHLDGLFHALSDSTRRAILFRLGEGERNVTELAKPFRMSLAAVSKHIKVLEDAGLVRKVKDGRTYRCQPSFEPLGDANRILEQLADYWHGRLDALEKLLTTSGDESDGEHTTSGHTEAVHKKGDTRKTRKGVSGLD